MKFECENCLEVVEFTILGNNISCPCCGYITTPTIENMVVGEKLDQALPMSQHEVLKEGDVVQIENPNHVWHGEIAIVRKVKHKFYRLEFGGRLTWIPSELVHKHEPFDSA